VPGLYFVGFDFLRADGMAEQGVHEIRVICPEPFSRIRPDSLGPARKVTAVRHFCSIIEAIEWESG
jgi:hypothetical protein